MNEILSNLVSIIHNDFEADFSTVMSQMPQPPNDATPEQMMSHVGRIFYRLAYMKGMAAGVEASQISLG